MSLVTDGFQAHSMLLLYPKSADLFLFTFTFTKETIKSTKFQIALLFAWCRFLSCKQTSPTSPKFRYVTYLDRTIGLRKFLCIAKTTYTLWRILTESETEYFFVTFCKKKKKKRSFFWDIEFSSYHFLLFTSQNIVHVLRYLKSKQLAAR